MSDEQQIAALTGELRRAGRTSFLYRWGLLLCSSFAGAALLLIVSAVGGLRLDDVPMAALLVTYFLVAWWLGRYLRSKRLQWLREAIGTMPPAARVDLLWSVERDRLRDTRAIAQSLIREFGVPTELAPAVGPDARGSEASPAEQQRNGRLDQ